MTAADLQQDLSGWARENGVAARFRVEKEAGMFRVSVVFENWDNVELSAPVSYLAACEPDIARVVVSHFRSFAKARGIQA